MSVNSIVKKTDARNVIDDNHYHVYALTSNFWVSSDFFVNSPTSNRACFSYVVRVNITFGSGRSTYPNSWYNLAPR